MDELTSRLFEAAEQRARQMDGTASRARQDQCQKVRNAAIRLQVEADRRVVADDLLAFMRSPNYPVVRFLFGLEREGVYLGHYDGDNFELDQRGIMKLARTAEKPEWVIVEEKDLLEVARGYRNENSRGLPSEKILAAAERLARRIMEPVCAAP